LNPHDFFFEFNLKKNDSVVSCRLFKNGTFTVESYYNKGPTSPVILNPSQPSIGLSEAKAKNVNGYIVCNFIRKNEFPGQENYFSLNSPWFLMMAKGGLKDESESNLSTDNFETFSLSTFYVSNFTKKKK
jgi:hypothetical protein